MIIEKCYNIHSLVRIRIRADPSVLQEVDYHLGPFCTKILDEAPDVIIDRYDAAPPAPCATVVDDYEYGSGVYHRQSLRLWINLKSDQQLYYMDRFALPINLIVQLALLRRGFTFLHGAALLMEGHAVLFPAYPGTGKTTLVAAFVKSGAKLFGDDLCIIGHGRLYSYPQAFSVYPHHLAVLPYKNEYAVRVFRKTAIIDKMCAPFEHSSSRWAKFLRLIMSQFRTPSINVMPGKIFGISAIAQEGILGKVVVIERSGDIATLIQEQVNIADIASQATAILWHEWHASFHDLLLYDALSEYGRYTLSLFKTVCDIYLESFQSVPCSRIRIPASWNNARLVHEFPPFFNDFC
jgi:hypothetical protein